jgi:hypothetical protein
MKRTVGISRGNRLWQLLPICVAILYLTVIVLLVIRYWLLYKEVGDGGSSSMVGDFWLLIVLTLPLSIFYVIVPSLLAGVGVSGQVSFFAWFAICAVVDAVLIFALISSITSRLARVREKERSESP